MIFVLLGLIILVISFVMALLSLTREQKRVEEKEREVEPVLSKNSHDLEHASVREAYQKPIEEEIEGVKPNMQTPQASEPVRKRFPWEEKKEQKEERVEKVGLGEKADITFDEDERFPWEIEEEVQEPKVGSSLQGDSVQTPRTELSGEINIRDKKD